MIEGLGSWKHSLVMIVIGGALTAVVCGLVYAILLSASTSTAISARQKDAVMTIDNTARILERIENCTTPGKGCYDRGQRQLASAVADVNRVVVLAAACASGPDMRNELYIQQCILDELRTPTGRMN